MDWNILKRKRSAWEEKQLRAGKRLNRKTKRWRKLQEQDKVSDDPSLPHKFTGRRRDVTGDPEGSGWRDIAAGKSKGTRRGQRAQRPIKTIGHGGRTKSNLAREVREEADPKWDRQEEVEEEKRAKLTTLKDTTVEQTRENLVSLEEIIEELDYDNEAHRLYDKLLMAFQRLEKDLEEF